MVPKLSSHTGKSSFDFPSVCTSSHPGLVSHSALWQVNFALCMDLPIIVGEKGLEGAPSLPLSNYQL